MNRTLLRLHVISAAVICLGITQIACSPADSTVARQQTPTRTQTAPSPDPQATITPAPPEGNRAVVTYVFDGDTVEVEIDGRAYRLRYIGVDSPEREEPFYQAALDFNREMVEDQTVILVRDVSDVDQYGRLLRYVYLPDGTFVNGDLMRNGMARLVTFPPDVAQTETLRQLQEEARDEGAGMWSDLELTGPCDCDRNLYDCRDFHSRDEAQTCFEYCLDKTGDDVHNLDGGGDGQVCEALP